MLFFPDKLNEVPNGILLEPQLVTNATCGKPKTTVIAEPVAVHDEFLTVNAGSTPPSNRIRSMINRFEILSDKTIRPDADRIIFCDGTGGKIFDPGSDLELSHWRPNRTPAEYRAGTSTEICFRFLDNPLPGDWTAAVNNHVDVDGILSVYVLVHSDEAQRHRKTIIEAAEIGDFWGWGELPAQRLFQGITRLMRKDDNPRNVYEEAFRRIPGLIDGTDPETADIEASLTPLSRGVQFVESGQIVRREVSKRFTQYIIPASLVESDQQAAYIPGFNELVSENAILWPQVRARWDAERVCLVSTERPSGWFHDLCYPGYLWADTDGPWTPPGIDYYDSMSSYVISDETLIAAVRSLQGRETAAGQWTLDGTNMPFGTELQEQFPVVCRFVNDDGEAEASGLSPDVVVNAFKVCW